MSMHNRFARLVERLRWLDFWIQHSREQAEAKLGQVNELLRQVSSSGLWGGAAVLGPILLERPYAPRPGGNDSGQVIQAVVLCSKGIGVAIFDSEEYGRLHDLPDGLAAEVPSHFVSFEDCDPACKALLLPQVEALLEKLLRDCLGQGGEQGQPPLGGQG